VTFTYTQLCPKEVDFVPVATEGELPTLFRHCEEALAAAFNGAVDEAIPHRENRPSDF